MQKARDVKEGCPKFIASFDRATTDIITQQEQAIQLAFPSHTRKKSHTKFDSVENK